eukprot:15443900-Alexandrium_andersonii.AAC.1
MPPPACDRVRARARRCAWARQAGPLGTPAFRGKGDPTTGAEEGGSEGTATLEIADGRGAAQAQSQRPACRP